MKEKFLKFIEPYKAPFKEFFDKVHSDSVDSISAQISFFIIISLIPFLMIVLSIFQIVNINGISLLNTFIKLLPNTVGNFILSLFPENTQLFSSISIAAITCLFSSSMAMRALINGINRIFNSKHRRGYLLVRLLAVLYTGIFAMVLVISVVLLIFGNTIYKEIAKLIPWHFLPMIIDFKSMWVFLLLTAFFTFSYYFIPFKVKHKLKNCFFGALIAATGWVLFSYFFSLFFENNARYSAIYGSLATLVIFMLWLYFCMYIMFLGAEISVFLEKRPDKAKNNLK